jgi:fructokinase
MMQTDNDNNNDLQLVVFGEALIDLKSSGNLAFEGFVGGSPLNVAVAAARLGVAAALAVRVSSDLFGTAIVEHLQKNQVSLALLERGDEPSTLAFVSANGNEVSYAFRNENAADWHYQPPASLPASVNILHYGAFNVMFDPAGSRVLALVAESQVLRHFDPNIRPSLVSERARYMQRFGDFLRLAHWCKLSKEDLEWLYPASDEPSVVAELLQAGPTVVVVTDGGLGARLYRQHQPVIFVPAPTIAFEDAIGAGDTFSGATIAALLERQLLSAETLASASNDQLSAVVRYAVAAAAINCTRSGCNPPYQSELLLEDR